MVQEGDKGSQYYLPLTSCPMTQNLQPLAVSVGGVINGSYLPLGSCHLTSRGVLPKTDNSKGDNFVSSARSFRLPLQKGNNNLNPLLIWGYTPNYWTRIFRQTDLRKKVEFLLFFLGTPSAPYPSFGHTCIEGIPQLFGGFREFAG